ncbi:MAG: hypothetical protein ACOZNI_25310 [Myxococcota bacterium]
MRAFRVVYGFLALNFALPTLAYAFAPDFAMAQFDALNRLLGGGPLPPEQSVFWWVLGVANVGTLAFCCALLLADVKRFFAVVYPLVFLKGFDAVDWAVVWARHGEPAYGAATVLDFFTVAALWYFPHRAVKEA